LSEEEQIEKLKEVALGAISSDIEIKVIDTLSLYGEKAIPAITEIIKHTISPDVEDYGLKVIKKIKKKL